MKTILASKLNQITLKTALGFLYLNYSEIIIFKAAGHNSLVYTVRGKEPLRVLHSLNFIDENFCNENLYRCHRSYIINLKYLANLTIKTNKLELKNKLVIPVSENAVRFLRNLSVNQGEIINHKHSGQGHMNHIFGKLNISRLFRSIFFRPGLRQKMNKLFTWGFLMNYLMTTVLFVCGCESKDRYSRPNLPEKLCCIALIDIDDTSHLFHYNPEYKDLGFGRYILFEKSFQSEYQLSSRDSLREFSFSISSDNNNIIDYKSNGNIKNYLKVTIPDSIKFLTNGNYYLKASENGNNEISASISVPEAPSDPILLSIRKELIRLSSPMEGWSLDEIDTVKSAILNISFKKDVQQKFYAIFVDGGYTRFGEGSRLQYDFLDFSILESNALGFFAEIYGIRRQYWHITDAGIDGGGVPVLAFFIDGNNIKGNNCDMTLSTLFHGPFSVGTLRVDFELFRSLRIKLLSIPPELYNFEKNLFTYNKVKDDPFAEPAYLNANIKGGNGVFAICRSKDLYINLSPPY